VPNRLPATPVRYPPPLSGGPTGGRKLDGADTDIYTTFRRICGCNVKRMASYKISEAARLLGVSDDTIRRWVEAGLLPTTDASPAEIPGDALAARAVDYAHAASDPTDVLSSARNRFVGLVTRLQVDGVMAQVDIQSGPHRVVSLLSSEAVRDLGLEVGSLAVAVVKATNVIVETPKG